ncbi:hypothetical protein [Pseudomonas putida]|uniref:Uncharacterized protein n=1 Tax=Pseudomonas putida TaxID=303 RepID=A0A8I1EH03_PSEPU|nr:hypothetical protein [Pseudomonas putida]MBI6885064.1 hypothetical protein [Pseudomonas putida]
MSYFELLVEAALAASHRRVLLKIYDGERNKHVDEAGNNAYRAARALADASRETGRDARESPIFASLGSCAQFYEEKFEQGRLVECDSLTPRFIHDAIGRGNKVRWQDWTVSASRPQEVTDAYGQFGWDRIITIRNTSGFEQKLEYADQDTTRAREIYKILTRGVAFINDGLPKDPKHQYDQCDEDELVW